MICFWKSWIKYDLFFKKVESELYYVFKIPYPNLLYMRNVWTWKDFDLPKVREIVKKW